MRIEQKQKWVLKVAATAGFDAPETALEPSDDVARLAVQVLPYDGQEHLFALALDVHGVPLACARVATGSVDNCPLFARDLFAWGVTVPRARFLGVAHNHPSGDVTPSGPDASGTALLMKLGQMMGLDVVWSLVVTHEGPQWKAITPKGQQKPKDGEQEPYQPKDPDEDKPEPEPEPEPEPDGTPNDKPDAPEDDAPEDEDGDETDSDEDGDAPEDEDGDAPEDEDGEDSDGDEDGDETDGDDAPEDEPEPAPDEDHKDDTGYVDGNAKKAPEASVDDLRAAIVAAFGLKQ
jgi:hypothetical protein